MCAAERLCVREHPLIHLARFGQVDVIEAQFAVLSSRIRGARDFKEVERAHQAYLDALLSQCFLDMRQIAQMLEAVFALCQRLCNYIQVRITYLDPQHLLRRGIDALMGLLMWESDCCFSLLWHDFFHLRGISPFPSRVYMYCVSRQIVCN